MGSHGNWFTVMLWFCVISHRITFSTSDAHNRFPFQLTITSMRNWCIVRRVRIYSSIHQVNLPSRDESNRICLSIVRLEIQKCSKQTWFNWTSFEYLSAMQGNIVIKNRRWKHRSNSINFLTSNSVAKYSPGSRNDNVINAWPWCTGNVRLEQNPTLFRWWVSVEPVQCKLKASMEHFTIDSNWGESNQVVSVATSKLCSKSVNIRQQKQKHAHTMASTAPHLSAVRVKCFAGNQLFFLLRSESAIIL